MRPLAALLGLGIPLVVSGQEASSPLASLPLMRDDAAVSFPYVSMLLIVLIAFAIIFVLARHRSGRSAALSLNSLLSGFGATRGEIQVLSSVRLDKGTLLHDVKWRGRLMLIASSEEGARALAEVAEQADGSHMEREGR